MSTAPRVPKYQEIASELRSQITVGTYPVGSMLPSTKALMARYDVSITVARAAIKELQNEGIAQGQTGKGVYVIGEPAPAQPSPEFIEISTQIADLRSALDSAMSQFDERLGALEQQVRKTRKR